MSKESIVDFRNLEVDRPLMVVGGLMTRLLVSSRDVIHRFSVPQLGFKLDCVPGRLNQGYIRSLSLGKFYGQCSEICGSNHSFMPISVECIPQSLGGVSVEGSSTKTTPTSPAPVKSGFAYDDKIRTLNWLYKDGG